MLLSLFFAPSPLPQCILHAVFHAMATQPVLANAGSDGSDAEFYEILVEMGLLDADANSQITDALRAAVLKIPGAHISYVRGIEHGKHSEGRAQHANASVSAVPHDFRAHKDGYAASSSHVAFGSEGHALQAAVSHPAGKAEAKGSEADGEGGEASGASSKAGGEAGREGDESYESPSKKPRIAIFGKKSAAGASASSSVLEVRPRLNALPPLPDLSSEDFRMIKCLVISNWYDLDGSAFQHALRHLTQLDRHILRVSATAKMRSANMDYLLGYRDAVLAEMKGQDMDDDDGGFPGVGEAPDEMLEAWGWELEF